MVRGLISFVTVGVAVVIQLTIVDRIAFPGGTGPDLVLLAVAALAVAGGPLAGTLIGFWGGLALDVAPPGSHFVGQNALVFCLIGYLCGLAADAPNSEGTPEQGHTALFEIVVTAVGVVCGEALASLLGAMLSDPRVTWSAIRTRSGPPPPGKAIRSTIVTWTMTATATVTKEMSARIISRDPSRTPTASRRGASRPTTAGYTQAPRSMMRSGWR